MDKTWTCVLLGAVCAGVVAIGTSYAVGLPGDGECYMYRYMYDPCSGCEKVYVGQGGEKCVQFGSKDWYTCEVGDAYDFCCSLDRACQSGTFDYWWPDEESGLCICGGYRDGTVSLEQHILNTADVAISTICTP